MVQRERVAKPNVQIAQERRLVTEIPGPRSRELHQRRRAAVASGVASSLPVFVEAAEESVIRDVDGNTFIDLGSGIAVTSLGHVHPAVLQAITAQAEQFSHTCFMVGPYESYVALCEQLASLTPGDHEKRSALFTSGAEAVENAVKIARRATSRSAIAVFDHAYHGRTNMTMALTSKNLPYKDGFGPFAPEVYRVPTSYPLRDFEGISGERAAHRAIDQLVVQVGAENLACVLIEPIHGEGGFIVPAPGFLPTLETWCREHGVVFAVDEIQTGFGRTGNWFASEHEGCVPDLVITAKAIASGLPLSAVTGRADLMDSVTAGGLGGTYGGNPIACAAAIATIDSMRELDAPALATRIQQAALPRLQEMQRHFPAIAEVRGRGAMLALEFVKPGTLQPDAGTCRLVVERCLAEGVIVLTCGTYGNVIRLLPPLIISSGLLTESMDALESALSEVLR